MKPKKSPASDPQMSLFRPELSAMINSSHRLVRLSAIVDWASLEDAFGSSFCEDNGHPGISTRLMVALHYLKFTFDLSDDAVVKGWVENPYWQYFSGMKWFEHEFPIHPSSMCRWRKRVGANGAEKLLEETIRAGLQLKAIKTSQLARVNVDTTVQEKHIRFPTDSRLYDRARARLVAAAKKRGIVLRQNYNKLSRKAFVQQSRYARAKQMKRARREQRRLKTFLGRVLRDIQRKVTNPDAELKQLLDIASRIFNQQRKDKNKVYSVHEPHVACIAKGKAHKKYEFGSKVSVAV
ncbi:IS5 family transposase, partial [Desulfosarcina sp. OttesenSCG-928-G17]|nr:IS5 family transposase [Desulfosarcina sp. OttesenSCG-928-G17]